MAVVGPADQSIELTMADALPANEPVFLEVQSEGGTSARFATELIVDRRPRPSDATNGLTG